MREKEDFEKHSARKMAFLQDQIHQKDLEIRDLEDKLKDVVRQDDFLLVLQRLLR